MLAVTGLVLATGPAAHAELYAPYARAAAIVDADGVLNNFKNVEATKRVATGTYCVRVKSNVHVADAVILVTSREPRRLPSIAYRNPSATCYHHANTIAIQVTNTSTGRLDNGGFDLAIL
ncbi:hypothetical protein [Nonomuraea sp. NPDC002799]